MIDKMCIKEDFNPIKKLREHFKYKLEFARNHPNYFWADGLVAFVGPQGSGKTLSAVNYVYNLLEKYPMSKLVTNLMLKDYPIVTLETFIARNYSKFVYESYIDNTIDIDVLERIENDYMISNRVFPFNDNDDFGKFKNDEHGVIFLVDEARKRFLK